MYRHDLAGMTPLTYVEGKIQSRVAKFLGMKETLIKLSSHPNLSTRTEAAKLMVMQRQLEGRLPEVLAIIQKVSGGAYTYSDVITATSFTKDFENHINNVDRLSQGRGSYMASSSLTASPLMKVAGIVGAVIFLPKILKIARIAL